MIKKLISKLRSGSFWVALIGALTLILSRLGYADAATLSENIVSGIASVLLIFGIAASPSIGGDGEQTESGDGAEKADEKPESENNTATENKTESDK